MKKKIIIVSSLIIILLVSISCFAYISNIKISNYIDENTVLREKIIVLGDLRTDIVKSSQLERLYMLTSKDVYQEDFNKNMDKIYNKINDLYDNGYITSSDKKRLTYTIDEYKSLSVTYFNKTYNNKISNQSEKDIIDFNNSQLNILKDISIDLTTDDESFSEKDNKISSTSNLQSKAIQSVSSVITLLISSFLYYFKKKLNKDNINIEDVIDYLTNIDNIGDDNKKSTKDTIPKNNVIGNNTDNIKYELNYVNSQKQKIYQDEILLSNANLLYKQSMKIKKEYDKSEIILNDIDEYIKKLRIKIQEIDEYPISAQKIILDDIENQLSELKFSFKSLPYYNNFIIDISKNIIDKNN